MEKQVIGYIVGGGLRENLRVRLTVPPRQVQEGGFVVVESPGGPADPSDWLFYGLVTDLSLGSTDPRFADEPSDQRLSPALSELLHGQTLFTTLEVLPSLMLEAGPPPETEAYKEFWAEIDAGKRLPPAPMPVKTVPPHHAPVRLASAGDIAEIFGKEDDPKKANFVIGYTREQGHPVCLDLKKFVQRSSGIFGATGSGKSFLTRIMLSGLIHTDVASVLVFDMHNEYGYEDVASDTGETVPGLKTKFSAQVRVVGLGKGATIRQNPPDFNLELAFSDIQPQDIELLSRELNLKETTPTTLNALISSFGQAKWLRAFMEMKSGSLVEDENGKKGPAPDSVAAWANAAGVNVMAAEGLHDKLRRVFQLPYLVEKPAADTLRHITDALAAGQHVVLSFGDHDSDLDYLLVTNLLTRRIREQWVEKTNAFRSKKSGAEEPRPLVIAVEEAHKLLNREMASQTTFSIIARELRKYFVTLLIIDQRPSQIYDEVLSQLGTRISGSLGDEEDIRAVLSGQSGKEALRGMLSHLQPKEEVLILGWGVPMPLPVRSRRYDARFWKELKGEEPARPSIKKQIADLGFA